MNQAILITIFTIEAHNYHWDRKEIGFAIDIDLEWLEASADMYNEHCIRVIGPALRRYCHG